MKEPEKKPIKGLTEEKRTSIEQLIRPFWRAMRLLFTLSAFCVFMIFAPQEWFETAPSPEEFSSNDNLPDPNLVVDGIHVQSGLFATEGYELVKNTCLRCHSGALITQNRADREGWEQMIRWMQETQGLQDLGDSERLILDYLAANYAPEATGRRKPLAKIEWYDID
ncbi:MAG: monoheme cytochrome C [Flavobacteriales bacterium]|nr:monoheme cytochrome C [Flavobacteriales bacterium]